MTRGRIGNLTLDFTLKSWARFSRYSFDFTRRDGTVQTHHRDVHDHGHAVAVLPCNAAHGTVVLVRQFRLPPHLNGDDGQVIEVCAGLIDADTPEVAARREAEEETGLRIGTLSRAFMLYGCPGALTERIHCYLASYEPEDRTGTGGGLLAEGEDIEVLELPFADAMAMIADGRIFDAKTVAMLQHAALTGVFGQVPAT